jgi:hypothetical protein
VKTVKDNQTRFWIDDNLKRNKIYRYKLRSFTGKGNNRKYSDFTYSVSATTYENGDKRVNSSRINKFKRNVSVGIMEKKKLSIRITPSGYSDAKKKRPISRKVRIAVLDNNKLSDLGKGYIQGVSEGKSKIYAIAHNGNYRVINVKIINYAKPPKWNNLDEVSSKWPEVLEKQEDGITDIASFFLQHPESQNTSLYLDENDTLINTKKVDLGNMENTIYRLLYDCQYELKITVHETYICFTISTSTKHGTIKDYLAFKYYQNLPVKSDMYQGYVKLADRWGYYYFVPV